MSDEMTLYVHTWFTDTYDLVNVDKKSTFEDVKNAVNGLIDEHNEWLTEDEGPTLTGDITDEGTVDADWSSCDAYGKYMEKLEEKEGANFEYGHVHLLIFWYSPAKGIWQGDTYQMLGSVRAESNSQSDPTVGDSVVKSDTTFLCCANGALPSSVLTNTVKHELIHGMTDKSNSPGADIESTDANDHSFGVVYNANDSLTANSASPMVTGYVESVTPNNAPNVGCGQVFNQDEPLPTANLHSSDTSTCSVDEVARWISEDW